jgi:hypothetical protein
MVLRQALDEIYDGVRTGRYSSEQLYKTERAHLPTIVLAELRAKLGLRRGGSGGLKWPQGGRLEVAPPWTASSCSQHAP